MKKSKGSTQPKYKTDAPAYLREFLDYMSTIKGRSKNTINSYYEDLKLFLRFLKLKNNLASVDCEFENVKIDDLSDEFVKKVTLYDVLEFLHFMADERNNVPKARARRAVSLRQFFKYLTDNKMWFSVNPVDKLQLPSLKKSLPKHLTIEQSTELLINAANEYDERDYCMLAFFLNCGMRLNELVNLNVNDYIEVTNPQTGNKDYLLKVMGKGSKERMIYLNDACVEAYNRYISHRKDVSTEKAMFLSQQNKRITDRRVQQIIKDMLIKSGLDGQGFSVHKLRHTAATLMYQNGVDVRVLKDVLGHENLGTTQIYTHVANEQLKKAMDKNPLAGFKASKKKNKNNSESED